MATIAQIPPLPLGGGGRDNRPSPPPPPPPPPPVAGDGGGGCPPPPSLDDIYAEFDSPPPPPREAYLNYSLGGEGEGGGGATTATTTAAAAASASPSEEAPSPSPVPALPPTDAGLCPPPPGMEAIRTEFVADDGDGDDDESAGVTEGAAAVPPPPPLHPPISPPPPSVDAIRTEFEGGPRFFAPDDGDDVVVVEGPVGASIDPIPFAGGAGIDVGENGGGLPSPTGPDAERSDREDGDDGGAPVAVAAAATPPPPSMDAIRSEFGGGGGATETSATSAASVSAADDKLGDRGGDPAIGGTAATIVASGALQFGDDDDGTAGFSSVDVGATEWDGEVATGPPRCSPSPPSPRRRSGPSAEGGIGTAEGGMDAILVAAFDDDDDKDAAADDKGTFVAAVPADAFAASSVADGGPASTTAGSTPRADKEGPFAIDSSVAAVPADDLAASAVADGGPASATAGSTPRTVAGEDDDAAAAAKADEDGPSVEIAGADEDDVDVGATREMRTGSETGECRSLGSDDDDAVPPPIDGSPASPVTERRFTLVDTDLSPAVVVAPVVAPPSSDRDSPVNVAQPETRMPARRPVVVVDPDNDGGGAGTSFVNDAAPTPDVVANDAPSFAAGPTIVKIDRDRAPPPPPDPVTNPFVVEPLPPEFVPPPAAAPLAAPLSMAAATTTTNPFVDDPNDGLASSRHGLAELDALEEEAWMSHRTAVAAAASADSGTGVSPLPPPSSVGATTGEEDDSDFRPLPVPVPPPREEAFRPPATAASAAGCGDNNDGGGGNNASVWFETEGARRREEYQNDGEASRRSLDDQFEAPGSHGPRSRTTSQGSQAASVGSSDTGGSRSSSRLSFASVHGHRSSPGNDNGNAAARGTGRRKTNAHIPSFSSVKGQISTIPLRGEGGVMEKLFGETNPTAAVTAAARRRSNRNAAINVDSAVGSILPRTLLPYTIRYNPSTSKWIATINTNQKALDSNDAKASSRAARGYPLPTKRQASELALSTAPPRMLPFAHSPVCFVCESKFAVFRRACHCRNCGVCVCSNCATSWPSKMIPDTYNIKRESSVNVCRSCNWLSSSFRKALLAGRHDEAVALHATGNANLRTPFANVKGEVLYPIHCAAIGGSLSLLRWLVDFHCCPIQFPRKNANQKFALDAPVATSKGRTLLSIAMDARNVDVLRYLVVEKDVSVLETKDLRPALLSLDAVLRKLPGDGGGGASKEEEDDAAATAGIGQEVRLAPPAASATTMNGRNGGALPSNDRNDGGAPSASAAAEDVAVFHHLAQYETMETAPSSLAAAGVGERPPETAPNATGADDGGYKDDSSDDGSVADACIICFENSIDCVLTPCGHQISCLACSSQLSLCPVCNGECSFIRVFKK